MTEAMAAKLREMEELWKLTDIVLEWNEKINVTAIREREEFFRKNVIDSLEFADQPELMDAKRILDLGTGGGFPGLPLAMLHRDKQFVLMDSVGKKISVVQDTAARLGLDNVTAIHARAEELARDPAYRERFDLVVSRAVANMSTLAEYCMPFVRVGGTFAAYKTEAAKEEIEAAAKAVKILGGAKAEMRRAGADEDCVAKDAARPSKALRAERSGAGEGAGSAECSADPLSGHLFVVVRKISATPDAYPRAGGKPRKTPL